MRGSSNPPVQGDALIGDVANGKKFSSQAAGIGKTGTAAGVQGTAAAADVRTGKTFSSATAGSNIAGSLADNGALNYTPSGAAQNIPAGITTGGQVAAVAVPVANVLTGTTIAGQAGTMPENNALNYNPSTAAQNIPAGHTSGGTVNPVGGNAAVGDVANGVTFSSGNGIGLTGTGANVKRWATGTFTSTGSGIVVSGLAFTPTLVMVYMNASNATYGEYLTLANKAGGIWGGGVSTNQEGYGNVNVAGTAWQVGVIAPTWTASGFTLPTTAAGQPFTWYAFE